MITTLNMEVLKMKNRQHSMIILKYCNVSIDTDDRLKINLVEIRLYNDIT